MTTSQEPDAATGFVVRSTTDLVALAPLVLGFHPHDSVVLLSFGGDASSHFHARVDLPTDLDDQARVVEVLVDPCRRNGARGAAVLLHTDDAEAARSQAALLVGGLREAGVAVVDVVRVEEDRWFPAFDDDAPGTAYDLTTHRFTAQRVFEGREVRRDRDELVASLVGTDDADLVAVTLAATRAADDVLLGDRPVREVLRPEGRWLQRRVRRYLADREPPSAADAGRLLLLASLAETREVAVAEVRRRTAVHHVELWQSLVRRSPPDLLPGAAALLAFAAWQAGDGALAWCALDRCGEVDAEHPLAELVAEALLGAVPPDTWVPVPERDLLLFSCPRDRRGPAGPV